MTAKITAKMTSQIALHMRCDNFLGGDDESGVGRETHKTMCNQYQKTTNILVSYSPTAMGFF